MSFDSSIRRRIKVAANETAQKLSDQEVFSSDEMKNYFQGLSTTMTGGNETSIELFEGDRDGVVAFTNGNRIVINTNNAVKWYFPTLEQRFVSLSGLFFHEIGHNLFLDFNEAKKALARISKGSFYGDAPSNLTAKEEADWLDMEAAIANETTRPIFASVFKELSNIVSDTHDEDAMIDRYGSFVGEGIYLCRNALHASCSLFEDMKQQADAAGGNDLVMAYNLLLQMTRFGDVLCRNENNLKNSVFGEMLEKIRPHAEIACVTDDSVRQFSELNYIMLFLWPFIRAQIQKMQDSKTDASAGQQSAGDDSGSGQPSNGKDSDGGSQNNSKSVNGNNGGKGSGNKPTKEQVEQIVKQLEKAAEKAGTTQAPQNRTSSQTAVGRRNAERKGAEKGKSVEGEKRDKPASKTGSDAIYNALDGIKNQIAQAKAEADEEKAAKEAVEEEVETVFAEDACSPHRGIPLIFTRKLNVTPGDKQTYDAAMAELSAISKRLQRQIEEALRDLKDGYVTRHRINGNMLVADDAYRPDGRCFAHKKLPQDLPDMAISVLVDHSGSMGGERIHTAMKAAMLLHDFATGLGIPISVAGHRTPDNGKMEYILYADFEQYSKNDKFRLAKMSASGCNRDGMALKISESRLEKRPEEVKLLIIISDGRPNHGNYGGAAAIQDIQSIVRDCKRKNIEVIAAAIGNDRKQIQEIYKDAFLDISDLTRLPRLMTALVKKRVLRNAL